MGMKKNLFWISLVLLVIGKYFLLCVPSFHLLNVSILRVFVIGSNAAGELTIVHSPESLKFTGSNNILESLIKDVFSASLGMSVSEVSYTNYCF